MAYIEINGAQIYYETFGQDQPGQAPVLLIHGSTITGKTDWELVAPLLARRRRVIVPDCRGHGKSSNPNLTYSFKELANDMAALVHALGYPRAHVIGHSNGGTLAVQHVADHPRTPALVLLSAHCGGREMVPRASRAGLLAQDRVSEVTEQAKHLVSIGRGRELMLLPGIEVSTDESKGQYWPITSLGMRQFDGQAWKDTGKVYSKS